MARHYSLDATARTMTGKRVRKLRVNEQIPAVIYGSVVETPIPVTVEERDLVRMHQAIGGSTLMDLNLDGETYTVYIRNLHMNPVKRRPLHAEFFAPNLTVEMTATIPLYLVGEPENTSLVVMHIRDTVELRGLPANLPGGIDVDVSTLESAEDSILVGELALPADVELITDPDEMIVRLIEPQMVPTEEEEAEEAAEDVEHAAEDEEDEE